MAVSSESVLTDFYHLLGELTVDGDVLRTSLSPSLTHLSEKERPQFIDSIHTEGLASLFYWIMVKSGNLGSLPESVQNRLRLIYSKIWMKNQRLIKELDTVSDRLHEAHIPIVLLKGACYIKTIYPDIGLRPMEDLDILIPEESIQVAEEIAIGLGYEPFHPEAAPGLHKVLSHHLSLLKPGKHPIQLEIHTRLVGSKAFLFSTSMDWFWQQVEPMLPMAGVLESNDHFMLTPTAQILYASAHALLQHGAKKAPLRWFYDIDRLIRMYAPRIDWDLLRFQAAATRWESALSSAITITHNTFASPIPKKALQKISDSQEGNGKVPIIQKDPVTKILAEIPKLKSLSLVGRIRLVKAAIFPSGEFMRWRYQLRSNWKVPIFYIIRWWIIFNDGMMTIRYLKKKNLSGD